MMWLMIMLSLVTGIIAQNDEDALYIKSIFDHTLTHGRSYQWLTTLSNEMPGRIAGSPSYDMASRYTAAVLQDMGIDSIWLQPCTVDYWVRESESLVWKSLEGDISISATMLGNSIGTATEGIAAEIVEVKSLEEVDSLSEQGVSGKIVFYNRPMDPTQINTFRAYGGAVDQRVWGASQAAKYGALAVIVRSMTNNIDDVPHTGTLVYREEYPKIPAMAISTLWAERLSEALKTSGKVNLHMTASCGSAGSRLSHNVIGEIRGSTYPNEIILVGGHLDSWDLGGGAHDDGAGCVHAMEVLATMKAMNYQPKRTIRCVLFSNEENGLAGATKYASASNEAGEFHLLALESDSGGFIPRGFSFDAEEGKFEELFKKVYSWLPLLEPYGLSLNKGGSGADVNPLKSQGGLLGGLRPDTQRYFDYHHTANDRIEAVNKRELLMGAASMSALVYLVDQYGLR